MTVAGEETGSETLSNLPDITWQGSSSKKTRIHSGKKWLEFRSVVSKSQLLLGDGALLLKEQVLLGYTVDTPAEERKATEVRGAWPRGRR